MSDFNQLKQKALELYFSRLNSPQQQAVFKVKGALLVLAGAGSGKTSTIINRIANICYFGDAYYSEREGSPNDCSRLESWIASEEHDPAALADIIAVEPAKPWNILAFTFTNKAAGELKSRLNTLLGDASLDIQASTFHSACVRILRKNIDKLGFSSSFTIYDSDDSQRLVKACMNDLDLSDKAFPPKSIAAAISAAKDKLMVPDDLRVDQDYKLMTVAKIYEEYQKRLHSSNALDFDDIICLTVKLLREFPEVRDYYRNRYKYILVDEYQDTNRAQFELINLLSGENGNLCVVGDDDQSIYRFRGATIENILSFEDTFADACVIRLEQNYRSTQNILSAANCVIRNNRGRKPKTLWTDSGAGEKVVLYKAEDEKAEARYVADTIALNVKNGAHYSDHAVLYRMNAQSNMLEKLFIQCGIPYVVHGGLRFFDRKEIRDVIAYLSVIDNRNDMLRFKRIINEPKRGIGDTTVSLIEDISTRLGMTPVEVMRNAGDYPLLSKKSTILNRLAKTFDSLSELAVTAPLDELLDTLLNETGYLASLQALGEEGVSKIENVEELKSSMRAYAEEADEPTLSGFLEEISLYTDIDHYDGEEPDKVVMMTVHSAKGLEFPQVFVVGMEEGIFPGARSLYSEDDIEEERRLAYVAITRAKERLYLCKASQRMLFGMTNRNTTSRFAKEIDISLIEKIDGTAHVHSESSKGAGTVGSIPLQLQGVGAVGKPKQERQTFTVGERVSHNIFGEGTVISVTPAANDNMLEVAFDKVGTKRLMSNIARITRLDDTK